MLTSSMYDQRHRKTRDPVRSPIDKPVTARLVVVWVTTREYLVLYFFFVLFFAFNVWVEIIFFVCRVWGVNRQ